MRDRPSTDAFLRRLRPEDQVFTSVITEGEIEFGLLNAQPSQRTNLRRRLDETMVIFAGVVDVTREVALRFAEVKAGLARSGRAISDNDMWIAAVAITNDMTLLHRDRGFVYVAGLRQLEWMDT